MKPLQRILVATSLCERAACARHKAAIVAAEQGSKVTLLHVLEPVERRAVPGGSTEPLPLPARLTRARKELARAAGELAAEHGVRVEFEIRVGDAVSTIVSACDEADVLFVGGSNAGWLSTLLQRATAQRLLGRCRIPIVVVNRPHDVRYETALVPVRLPRQGDASEAMAPIKAAAWLWPTATKFVFHALDTRDERAMELADVPSHAIRSRLRARRARAKEALRRLASLAGVRGARAVCSVGHGNPRRAVLSARHALDADALVLVKRKTSALMDLVFGSIVRRLLRAANSDVVVVPR